eukprot:scaffold26522_cov63-Phaeocystis_antarctica.AAC.9
MERKKLPGVVKVWPRCPSGVYLIWPLASKSPKITWPEHSADITCERQDRRGQGGCARVEQRTARPASNIPADSNEASIIVGSDGNRVIRPALSADGDSPERCRARGRRPSTCSSSASRV